MHHNNLGIEQDCDWGVPIPDGSKPDDAVDAPHHASFIDPFALKMEIKEEQFINVQSELVSVE